jgi:hypothetical protein
VRLTVPRCGGGRAGGAVRADFERALADPVDPAIASAEIASELRRGGDYVWVTVAFTVVATDVADALAIAWDAFRGAARDDLTGWEVTAAAAEVQPEPPLTEAAVTTDRRSFTCRLNAHRLRAVSFRFAYAAGRPLPPRARLGPQSVRRRRGPVVAVKGDAVTSALACVGLSVRDEAELSSLVTSAYRTVRETGVFAGVHVGRWQDASGAVLILGWRSSELVDFVPAYAAASGGLLAECRLINDSVAVAKVIDAGGQQVTAMAFEAEQYRQLDALGRRVSGPARITALGVDVQVDPDADVFAASPGSQLDLSAGPVAGPPPHDRESGWSGPPRLAAESFISYGIFAESAQARPHARLSGTVLDAGRGVCALTGQPFTVAPVRTAGFEADVCLAGSAYPHLPAPGTIISGTVVLSAAIDAPLPHGQVS